jgi:hypothetical protein
LWLISQPETGSKHVINNPEDTIDLGTNISGGRVSPKFPDGDWIEDSEVQTIYWDTATGKQYVITSRLVDYDQYFRFVNTQLQAGSVVAGTFNVIVTVIASINRLFDSSRVQAWIPVQVSTSDLTPSTTYSVPGTGGFTGGSIFNTGTSTTSDTQNIFPLILVGAGFTFKSKFLIGLGIFKLIKQFGTAEKAEQTIPAPTGVIVPE